MLKAVLAATTALTLAGATVALAQPGDRARDQGRRFQPTVEDIRAFQAARLAALRAGLMLNAEQEKHWPAFEQAARELQQLRLNRITALREARREQGRRSFDPAERLRRQATRMAETGAVLKKLADATEPLYRSLDDGQRRRFAILSRMAGPRGGPPGRRFHRGDGGQDGDPVRSQRRTEMTPVPGTGALPVERSARKPVDSMPLAPTEAVPAGFSRKPVGINYKSTGFNQKPVGFNQMADDTSI
jgi:hypothetical protein